MTAVGGCDIFRPPRENLDNLSSVFDFKQPDGSLARATHRFVIAHKCTSPTYEEFNGLRAVLRLSTCWFSPKSDGPANYVRRTWNLSREEYAKEWRTFVDNGWILPSEWERKLKEIVDCDCSPTEPADESTVCPLNVKKENKSAYRLLMENFLVAMRRPISSRVRCFWVLMPWMRMSYSRRLAMDLASFSSVITLNFSPAACKKSMHKSEGACFSCSSRTTRPA